MSHYRYSGARPRPYLGSGDLENVQRHRDPSLASNSQQVRGIQFAEYKDDETLIRYNCTAYIQVPTIQLQRRRLNNFSRTLEIEKQQKMLSIPSLSRSFRFQLNSCWETLLQVFFHIFWEMGWFGNLHHSALHVVARALCMGKDQDRSILSLSPNSCKGYCCINHDFILLKGCRLE